jgi:hypothetical protein
MKPIKQLTIIAFLMALAAFLFSCKTARIGKCEGRQVFIGYGADTKSVIKFWKKNTHR